MLNNYKMSTKIQQLKQTLDNLKDSTSDLSILIEFEEVLDNLHIYSFKNWEYGEVLSGPEVTRYWVTVGLIYPYKLMPDPDGALRLIEHGAEVYYNKDVLIEPVDLKSPDDLGPTDPKTGKRKPKKKKSKVWVVTIKMPREFVDEFESSKVNINGISIDLSDVDGAYDDDSDGNNAMPDKDKVIGGLE